MKSRGITIGILLGVVMLSSVIIDHPRVLARPSSATAGKRQQTLVKRINQRAVRFYKAFIRQSVTTTTVDCELNDLLEDLLLAADSLTDSRYLRHNLVVVMQIASDVEQELLEVGISSDLVMAWGRLLADLDRLAKMNGITWGEAVITNQLIATLASDVATVSKKFGHSPSGHLSDDSLPFDSRSQAGARRRDALAH